MPTKQYEVWYRNKLYPGIFLESFDNLEDVEKFKKENPKYNYFSPPTNNTIPNE